MTHTEADKSGAWLNRIGITLLAVVVLFSMPVGFVSTGAAAGDTTVELTPATQSIDAGTTSTVDINVTDVNDGVGSYQFTLNTSATETLTITDVELAGSPGQSDVNIADDGSSVEVQAALADTADSGTVSIATVTIQGETAGSTDLTFSDLSIGDESGNSYTITETGSGTVEVQESTTIQNTTISPATVDEQTTTTQSLSFDALKMSSDGNTDSFTITAPADVELADPEITITDATGETVALESGPDIGDAGDGTNNELTFAIAPDNSFDTTELAVGVTTTVTYPEVASNQSSEFAVDIADSSGETATDRVAVTVENTDTTDGGDSNQTVALSPAEQNVTVNESTTVDLEIGSVTNGVGAYDFTLTLNDSARAVITDVSLGGDPGQADVSIADDGSNVSVTAALADTADTGTVTLTTVTITGADAGTVSINPVINDVGDESGNPYTIAETSGATLTVEGGPGDVTGDGNAAQDIDGDGLYEDVNGDGKAGASDVQAFFAAQDSEAIQSNPAAFDFNGDGTVSISDIQALFSQLV